MQIAVSNSRAVDCEDAQVVDFTGYWTNEIGGRLLLNIDTSGAVKGKYWTAPGTATSDEEFEVCGYASNDHISIVANLGRYGSLLCWAGQLISQDGKEFVKTNWLLTKNISDEFQADWIWPAILSGSNLFIRS